MGVVMGCHTLYRSTLRTSQCPDSLQNDRQIQRIYNVGGGGSVFVWVFSLFCRGVLSFAKIKISNTGQYNAMYWMTSADGMLFQVVNMLV